MGRFTVMGFTEAELGLVLAALLAGVAGNEIVTSGERGDVYEQLIDSLRSENEALAFSIDSLRRAVDKLRPLTSSRTPACSEKGESSESVAHVTVENSSSYRLDEVTMSFAEVLGHLAPWVSRSRVLECRFWITVQTVTGLDTDDWLTALEPLRPYFFFRYRTSR
jgi:hypothetical protein